MCCTKANSSADCWNCGLLPVSCLPQLGRFQCSQTAPPHRGWGTARLGWPWREIRLVHCARETLGPPRAVGVNWADRLWASLLRGILCQPRDRSVAQLTFSVAGFDTVRPNTPDTVDKRVTPASEGRPTATPTDRPCRQEGERVSAPPSLPQVSGDYFEAQVGAWCGMHALNNLLGGPYVTQDDCRRACGEVCRRLSEVGGGREDRRQHLDPDTGWLSIDVINILGAGLLGSLNQR